MLFVYWATPEIDGEDKEPGMYFQATVSPKSALCPALGSLSVNEAPGMSCTGKMRSLCAHRPNSWPGPVIGLGLLIPCPLIPSINKYALMGLSGGIVKIFHIFPSRGLLSEK